MADLKIKETVELRKGWKADILFNEETGDKDIRIYTLDSETGQKKFYEVTTVDSPYCAPFFNQEPDLKISVTIHDTSYDVVGAVVLDENGAVTGRFSWSNLEFVKKQTFEIAEGKLFVDGQDQGFISMLILPDKNRMRGYVAFCTPNPPLEQIQIKELEDLALTLLQ